MKRSSKTIACIALFAAFAVACQPNVAFDNLVPNRRIGYSCFSGNIGNFTACSQDNTDLEWGVQAGFSPNEMSNLFSVQGEIDGTDFRTTRTNSITYSGDYETDIVYTHHSFGGTTIGATWCEDSVNGSKCDQWYVAFKDTLEADMNLACHESGHALGLLHGNDASPAVPLTDSRLGCMVWPADFLSRSLGSYTVREINNAY